jgi:hypothetical protein
MPLRSVAPSSNQNFGPKTRKGHRQCARNERRNAQNFAPAPSLGDQRPLIRTGPCPFATVELEEGRLADGPPEAMWRTRSAAAPVVEDARSEADFPHPHQEPTHRGWIASLVWQDATTGQEVRAESGIEYATYAEALLASQELGQDTALRDQLEPQYRRNGYWRRREPWLLKTTGLRNRPSLPELDSPATASDPAAAETDHQAHSEAPGRAGSAFSKRHFALEHSSRLRVRLADAKKVLCPAV